MVVSVVAPRRSIREAVLHRVLAYHGGDGGGRKQQQRWRWSFYGGGAGGSGGDEDGAAAWGAEEECTMELAQLGADRPKNVLVLMSDTGGGHRASAEAIRDAFRLEFGDEYRVFVKDLGKEHAGWPLNDMERTYKFMVKHVSLWKVAFHGTYPRWVHCSYLAALAALYARFHAGVDRCYCPSEEVSKRALLEGLKPSQIRVFGLPVRPSFCRAVLNKDDLREELEMHPHLPAVLLMGGGEGMGPVEKTAMALGEALFDEELGKPIGQIVVICGRNQILSSTLQSTEWRIPVKIRGFETQMEKWMGACDCIITKAGPGTIAEALIRGLPIILNDFIPGQEVGNIPYVVENGAGAFSKSPKETASLVARWFGPDRDELKKFSGNALKLARPGAVFDIVKDIHQLVQQRGPMERISYSLTSSFSYAI
ncbi:Monogalactosyldiacylglycerol synthase 2, chloroplastic [Cocos nucifera]|uniref:monogalactosyldiacylglycerol synthase n=1 Tax=Cocos nucifera TaxID=13894 RepID=A0A8K0IR09_COCNU|nr:Monogalactosyldiacylglycerol synthase 2, chloroplastic [Cocos nucifera]